MVARLERAIEEQADALQKMPHGKRQERAQTIEHKIEALRYTEEALVCRNGAKRSAGAPPAAVLGVRVVEKKHASRTA